MYIDINILPDDKWKLQELVIRMEAMQHKQALLHIRHKHSWHS